MVNVQWAKPPNRCDTPGQGEKTNRALGAFTLNPDLWVLHRFNVAVGVVLLNDPKKSHRVRCIRGLAKALCVPRSDGEMSSNSPEW
jgi:hypothetical protein